MLSTLPETDVLMLEAMGVGACLLGVLGILVEMPVRTRTWRTLLLLVPLVGAPFVLIPEFKSASLHWLPLVFLAGASAGCYALRSARARSVLTALAALPGRPHAQSLLLFLFGAAVFIAVQFLPSPDDAVMEKFNRSIQMVVDETNLQLLPDSHVLTDRGRIVPLHRPSVDPIAHADLLDMEKALVDSSKFDKQLIRTGPPDLFCNCHGWTFLGGQYWIRGRNVPQILEDNGYKPISMPQSGDVAIFRDVLGQVSHSAIVRGVGSDGLVILESKWGWAGRFLHSAQGHAYGSDCTFYRTDRSDGHRLRQNAEPKDTALSGLAG